MKKTILITVLCLCAISTKGCAQLETKNNTNHPAKQLPLPVLNAAEVGESGSGQKKPLTPEDYKLWTMTFSSTISSNGAWYAYNSYHKQSEEGTLIVGSTNNDISYKFRTEEMGQFSPESKWFGCLVQGKGLGLLNLESGFTQWISNVSKFEFSSNDRFLIAFMRSSVSTKQSNLLIMDLYTGKQESIVGIISDYKLNATSNTLGYILNNKDIKSVNVRKLAIGASSTTITENASYEYITLRWNSNGDALIFLEGLPEDPEKQHVSYKLYYYNVKQAELKSLDPGKTPARFGGMTVTHAWHKPFHVSEDGTVVIFSMQKSFDKTLFSDYDTAVEVYHTKDKRLMSKQKKEFHEYGPWLTAWWPETGKIRILETQALPKAEVTTNGKYILSYDPHAYDPQFKHRGDVDLYLTDLETGKQQLLLKQAGHKDVYPFKVSPTGKYLSYFREGHWWLYDFKKQTHSNITKGLGVTFYKTEAEGASPGELTPHGVSGWSEEDKALIVYDSYDVWLITPKGKATRITKGREEHVRYRVVHAEKEEGDTWSKAELKTIKTAEGFIMKTFSTTNIASGYAIWKPKTVLKTLVYKDMYVSGIKKAKNRNAYIYKEESFNTPPRYCYWEEGMSDAKILAETNLQHNEFQWGHSELIRYKDAEGNPLQGALFYPANYRADKKYPMIVKIYETLSHELHHYENPTEYSNNGFNHTNYTAEGYLVFFPDIKYTYNDPGISAVRCIEAGVKAVLEKGVVEANHIGLIGHSFGGYETAFTSTQTNLFAAVVAGAGIMDLVSWYHGKDYGDSGDVSRIWRFEDGQHRFKDSFYKNPEAYFRNTPLHHITNINIPVLLWTGKEDNIIGGTSQSMELYTGLRRLGKTCELLIYPGEPHSLKKPQNQIDLTRRIKAWFDRYLKPDGALKKL